MGVSVNKNLRLNFFSRLQLAICRGQKSINVTDEEMMRSDVSTCNKTTELYKASPFIFLF